MKTFFFDLIPRLKEYSAQLDDYSLLINKHWILLDEVANSKILYIFRPNDELLISQNGKVQKALWQNLGNNSLLIDVEDGSYLFKTGFFDETILALSIDGTNEYAFLLNENKFKGSFNSFTEVYEFLTNSYLNPKDEDQTLHPLEPSSIRQDETKNIVEKKLDNGSILRIYSTSPKLGEYNRGDKAEIDGYIPEDGNYHYGFTGSVTIEDKVVKW